jgi:hypothetical protein
MNKQFFKASLAAACLTAAVFFSPAMATESCETANELGCNMPIGAFFKHSHPSNHAAPSVKHRSTSRNYLLAAPPAAKKDSSNWCDIERGTNGSAMPSSLYGRCGF